MGNPFQSKKIKPDVVDPLRPEMRGLSSDLGSYGQTLVGKQATPYTGSLTSPITGGEQDILAAINRMTIGGDGAYTPTAQGLINDILSGNRLRPETNPYLSSMMNSLSQYSSEGLGRNLNLVDAAFGKTGMGTGSGRSMTAIETGRQAQQDLNNQISNILGTQYQQGMQEQYNTLANVLPQQGQQQFSQLLGALSASALPRQIQQQDLGAQYQEFLRQLQEPMGYTQLVSQILGSSPGLQYMQPQYAPSPISQILGGAAQVGQAALPFVFL